MKIIYTDSVLKKLLTHYFIPQPKNNHRATVLKPNCLIFLLVLYLLSQSIIKSLTIVKPGILGYSSEITAQKVLDQTNNERIKLGLEPLVYNSVLSESAKEKADDMFTNNYWAHNSPQGKTPWTFFDAVGYKYSTAGENLAKDFYNTDSLVSAWMNSPTHKENIINTKYKEIGIAVVNGTLGDIKTTLVVQHFGTPLTATTKEIISPKSNDIVVPEVLSQTSVLSSQNEKLISPLTLSKIFSSVIFIILMVVLFIDGFITVKNNIHRLTGSTVGHIGFLFFIFLLMIFNQQGSIF
ncbi:MAG: CAP domain-containing protein [Candidatus Shapirobacteria bacterium]|nr:CAP domain-containing protein [Candidatus Shapirobacteria bacterium]MDD4383153.1 CAP domain-containing protein [Candidatus Shapirobacteria bacterium]